MTWWNEGPLLPHLTVYETEQPRPVIYDHNGQPYVRRKPPLGFIDPSNLPTSKPTVKD